MLDLFSFLGNSHNGWYEKSNITRIGNADPNGMVNVTFQDLEQVWEYRSALYHEIDNVLFSQYRGDIGIESSILSVDNFFEWSDH